LPQSKQRRVPLRLRHPVWIILVVLILAGVAVAIFAVGADQTTRGTGTQGAPREAPGLVALSLGAGSAQAYDPLGDRTENSEQARFAVDRDRNTTWSTERYDGGVLNKPGSDQPGVGLIIDTKPEVAARRLRILTTTPGWTAEVYASAAGVPAQWPSDQWVKVATSFDVVKDRVKVDLDTAGKAFRYYLIWITKVPPQGKASISEVYLYSQK
jgi:serine/threonine-protein kinase